MKDTRPIDNRSDEQRRIDHEAAQKAMNDILHDRKNAVRTTRLTTVKQLNDALRRAAGRVPHDEERDT